MFISSHIQLLKFNRNDQNSTNTTLCGHNQTKILTNANDFRTPVEKYKCLLSALFTKQQRSVVCNDLFQKSVKLYKFFFHFLTVCVNIWNIKYIGADATYLISFLLYLQYSQ